MENLGENIKLHMRKEVLAPIGDWSYEAKPSFVDVFRAEISSLVHVEVCLFSTMATFVCVSIRTNKSILKSWYAKSIVNSQKTLITCSML